MKGLICDRCGGHINERTMKCEYCGTQFKRSDEGVIRIETFNNPVREFAATIAMSDMDIYRLSPERASEICMHELVKKLSVCLVPAIRASVERNPTESMYLIRGSVKVVIPENGGLERWLGR